MSYYWKILNTKKEKDFFDKAYKEFYEKKTGQDVGLVLLDLVYFAIFNKKHEIIAGCKLAYSCKVKDSNSSTGHRFPIERYNDVYNLGIDVSEFVSEKDIFVELGRLFSTVKDKKAIRLLYESLYSLFAYQGIDFALVLIEQGIVRLLSKEKVEIELLQKQPVKFPQDEYKGEYYLYKITHRITQEYKKAVAEGRELEYLLQLKDKSVE